MSDRDRMKELTALLADHAEETMDSDDVDQVRAEVIALYDAKAERVLVLEAEFKRIDGKTIASLDAANVWLRERVRMLEEAAEAIVNDPENKGRGPLTITRGQIDLLAAALAALAAAATPVDEGAERSSREGCECDRLGLTDRNECVYSIPCPATPVTATPEEGE